MKKKKMLRKKKFFPIFKQLLDAFDTAMNTF